MTKEMSEPDDFTPAQLRDHIDRQFDPLTADMLEFAAHRIVDLTAEVAALKEANAVQLRAYEALVGDAQEPIR